MRSQRIKFENIKMDRGWYYVIYQPPFTTNNPVFANIDLVILDNYIDINNVVSAMEKELKYWIKRYPIPVMISAFDSNNDLINLKSIKPCDHLIGYSDYSSNIKSFWRLLKNDEFPNRSYNINELKSIYYDVNYKTIEEIKNENERKYKELRNGIFIIFVWAIVVPAFIVIAGWTNPLIATIVMVYSLSKAFIAGLKYWGKIPRSIKEEEDAEKERKMKHYYYHCEKNPEGFLRLKADNFVNDERGRILRELNELRGRKK
jgi:hypothetical protein